MNTVLKISLAATALALGGCATIVKGSSQSIAIDSTPTGASCEIKRAGVILGQISATPSKYEVSRGKDPLEFTCAKPGFAAGTATAESKFNGATLGNILLGGVIGVVVDASTGANYSYPEQVTVALQTEGGATATDAAAPVPAVVPAAAAMPAEKPAEPAKPKKPSGN